MFIELASRLNSRPAKAVRLAGLAALIYWQFSTSRTPAGFHGRDLVVLILLAGAAAAWLAWGLGNDEDPDQRRGLSWELFVLATCGGLLVGPASDGPGNVFVFVAAFVAGVRVPLSRAFLVTALAIISLSISWIVYDIHGLGALAYGLGLIATTFGGSQRREGMLRHEQAELLLAQTQRSHEEQLRTAKLQESNRIAREIHDVLAHSLAGLTIQLEATAALIEGGADAESILPRVRHAHELAREGLRETRLAVGALRSDGTSVAPAAARIEALASDFRATGKSVELVIDGERAALEGPPADAVVRIIQEALTNVTKHAPATASVRIDVDAGPSLLLAVESRVPVGVAAAPSSLSGTGGGYGIAGMRERAEEFGGSLDAGPTDAGWLVRAEIPAVHAAGTATPQAGTGPEPVR